MRFNNEDIILTEDATRNFLTDLFCSDKKKEDSILDSINLTREETDEGVIYHFPDLEIQL